jgi:hypothetical protein
MLSFTNVFFVQYAPAQAVAIGQAREFTTALVRTSTVVSESWLQDSMQAVRQPLGQRQTQG